MSELIYTPRLDRNVHFSHLGAPKACQTVVISVAMAETRHCGRMFGQKNGPKTAHTATGFELARPKQEIMSEIKNTPRLARNAHVAHLGAPRGYQSVVVSVHMAKTRHSGRMFERKTARKRPKRDRFRISATQTGNSARNSKHTMASPKYPFCSSRCSYGMPKCGPIGSYGQNQAL